MKLQEDLFEDVPTLIIEPLQQTDIELEGPDTPEDNGVSTLLIDAISEEWKSVDRYNALRVTVEGLGFSDIEEVIKSIQASALENIGRLQKALESISPNVAITQQGEVSAEATLAESAMNEIE